jgi:hypothetical protein
MASSVISHTEGEKAAMVNLIHRFVQIEISGPYSIIIAGGVQRASFSEGTTNPKRE